MENSRSQPYFGRAFVSEEVVSCPSAHGGQVVIDQARIQIKMYRILANRVRPANPDTGAISEIYT